MNGFSWKTPLNIIKIDDWVVWGCPYFSKPPSAIIGSTIKSPGPSRAIHQIPLRPRQEHVIGMWPTLWPFHMQSTGDQLLGPRWIIRDRKQNKIYCHICLWNYLTKYPSPKQTSDFIPCHMGRIIPWFHVSYMASEKGVPHSIRGYYHIPKPDTQNNGVIPACNGHTSSWWHWRQWDRLPGASPVTDLQVISCDFPLAVGKTAAVPMLQQICFWILEGSRIFEHNMK